MRTKPMAIRRSRWKQRAADGLFSLAFVTMFSYGIYLVNQLPLPL